MSKTKKLVIAKEETNQIHISHLHQLVSAYETCDQTVNQLWEDLLCAQVQAKKTTQSVIVSQDCNDHFFVVHPSGSISLCCTMRTYEVVPE